MCQPSPAIIQAGGLCLAFIALLCFIALKLLVYRKTRQLRNELAGEIKKREAVESANKARADFLAAMSHEIRTPMNAVFGFTDLALKTELNPELRDYLRTVRTSAEWLMHVVSDLLEFSRIEAGHVQLDTRDFSLEEAIRSVLRIVQPDADAKGLALRVKIDPQIPATVCGDSARLRQVIFNLLDNAVKFTVAGSVVITAGLESKSSDSVLVRISVTDTGIGIPPRKRTLLFEPFRSTPEIVNGSPRNTGLGLATARKLVMLMGGTIEFQSQLGAGTTFQFTTWFRKQRVSADTNEHLQDELHERCLSILVAEDNAVNRRLITKVLESAGHRVTSVVNGKEAVEVFEAKLVDLILMDMDMPDMNGLEATEKIRAIQAGGSHTPIYALTAHTALSDRERCFAAGMDGFISKPIDVDDVLKLVDEVSLSSQGRYENVEAHR